MVLLVDDDYVVMAPSRPAPLAADAPVGHTAMLHRASRTEMRNNIQNPPLRKFFCRLLNESCQPLLKVG